MHIFDSIFIFLFGLIIGSFLNAVIYRLKFGGSIICGRSKCPHCQHILGFLDLFPVLSFIFLRGRCKYCHKRISVQYPLVEFLTALLFILVYNFQFSIFNYRDLFYFLYVLFIICCLIVIFVYDLKHFLILDKVLIFAAIFSVIFQIILFILDRNIFHFWSLLYGLLIIGCFLGALHFLSRGKWLGLGDVKFGLLMALWLGSPKVVVALFFAFVIGGIFSAILLVLRKKKLKSQIPFGPFLVAGTFIALLWGEQIFQWYLGWLGL